LPDPYQAVKREMRGRDFPVLLTVPAVAPDAGEGAEAYLRELIRKTMGYDIKL
jgi:V/A-type H+-transporting ATPase subunit F